MSKRKQKHHPQQTEFQTKSDDELRAEAQEAERKDREQWAWAIALADEVNDERRWREYAVQYEQTLKKVRETNGR